MADFRYVGTLDGSEPAQEVMAVAAGSAASIDIGDLVVIANGYAAKIADGGGNTINGLYGLAVSVSTDTASADGTVQVLFAPSGLVCRGIATTPANLTTAAKYDRVTIDVAAGVQKVDENDTTNGSMLIYRYPTSTPTTDGFVDIVVPFNVSNAAS